MKILPWAAFFFLFHLVSNSSAEPAQGPRWIPPAPSYGQIKIVPSKNIADFAETGEWDGPWIPLDSFAVRVLFSEDRQTSPGNFTFVTPMVGLEGNTEKSTETHSTSAPMFDTASARKDVTISYEPSPREIAFDTEYPAATLTSPKAITKWKIFVRFTRSKPEHVRDSKAEK